ncbi:alpha/beta fold hydrolase [Sulfitobacter sp. PS-8MA]|uniref:alpha/beta fold hydrolase n=1 Tax=Sulfitobacter sp. PS-8MA TaxID=3237707 RepID=UPI0034C5C929
MSVLKRNNVNLVGQGQKTIVFVHGFGCDQTMWRFVAPALEEHYRVVLYDLTGAGQSDLSAYDFNRYSDLSAHAADLVEICDALELEEPIVIGHSVGAIIAGLAAADHPGRFAQVVMVSPSPCFVNDGEYIGGFDRADLLAVIDFMQENYLGWAEQMAPAIAGQEPEGESARLLTKSFCRTNPDIARHFGRVTFLSDRRADMTRITTPTLILQCDDDAIAPVAVGDWMYGNMTGASLRVIEAMGHCPHMTEPKKVIREINRYLSESG